MGILTEAGLPDIAESLRSSQISQIFTGDEKMVLCKPKPLHNTYYVSIYQCVLWGWAYGRWTPGGMKTGCSTNNPNRRNRHIDNRLYLYRRICFLCHIKCE